MFNIYDRPLKVIVHYIEALNAAERAITEAGFDNEATAMPYPKEIKLTDCDGSDYGVLRDEIGGSWSWFPPLPPDPGGDR